MQQQEEPSLAGKTRKCVLSSEFERFNTIHIMFHEKQIVLQNTKPCPIKLTEREIRHTVCQTYCAVLERIIHTQTWEPIRFWRILYHYCLEYEQYGQWKKI